MDKDISLTKEDSGVFSKYKFLLLGIVLVLVLVLLIIFFVPKKEEKKLSIKLEGTNEITIYVGDEYEEPGYYVIDSDNNKLDKDIEIESNVDTSKPGEYIITYKINGYEIKRKVIVKEKPVYRIILEKVNDSESVYLKINDEYEEPGYKVLDSNDKDVTSSFDVEVSDNIDISKAGSYKVIYKIYDSNNEEFSVERAVIVIENSIELSVDKTNYTNASVLINIKVLDDYFDYVLLPSGNKIYDKEYSYSVEENGIYKFVLYNQKGFNIEKEIEIKNIDKEKPTGSCTAYIESGKTYININSKDNNLVKEYVIGQDKYKTNDITLNEETKDINVDIYDEAGNKNSISCKATDRNIKITITPDTKEYTKNDIILTITVESENFDYVLVPSGSKVYKKMSTYTVKENGKYNFTVYDKDGNSKSSSITINNIDKVAPTGTCSGEYENGVTRVTINASDNVAVSKYLIDGVYYYNKNISLNKKIDILYVSIYDSANNYKNISCKINNLNPSAKDNPIYLTEQYHDNSINGIRYRLYNQADSRWGSVKYPNGETIKSIGCMLTSSAVISSAHDVEITPKTVFDNRRNLWASDDVNHLAGESFTCTLHWALSDQNLDDKRMNLLYDALKKGHPVIIRVHGSKHSYPGSSKFTSSQHYMALIDYKDNKIFVGNSYSSSGYGLSGWYDESTVLTSVRELIICVPSQSVLDKYK